MSREPYGFYLLRAIRCRRDDPVIKCGQAGNGMIGARTALRHADGVTEFPVLAVTGNRSDPGRRSRWPDGQISGAQRRYPEHELPGTAQGCSGDLTRFPHGLADTVRELLVAPGAETAPEPDDDAAAVGDLSAFPMAGVTQQPRVIPPGEVDTALPLRILGHRGEGRNQVSGSSTSPKSANSSSVS